MFDNLPILALETSQSNCGACVYFDDNKFSEININIQYSHAEKIFEIIDLVMKISKVNIKDLGTIAVSSGPGSFTGLRIGLSAAKGIALGASLQIVTVPTFEALAFQLAQNLKSGTKFAIANKVNSEEIYLAKFQVKTNNYIFTKDLRIVKAAQKHFNSSELIYGNANFDFSVRNHIKSICSPKPEYIAKWAKYFGKDLLTKNFDLLEPNYLKNFIIKGNK